MGAGENPPQDRAARAAAVLESLWREQAANVETIPWLLESERFEELVFCALNAWGDGGPARARELVETLRTLDLLAPSALAPAVDEGSPLRAGLIFVLVRAGYPEDRAASVVASLARLGDTLAREHGGRIQRLLQTTGEELARELLPLLTGDPDGDPESLDAISLWLQNVLNLPVRHSTPALRSLCAEHDITSDELYAAADDMGLNLAAVDDLVAADAEART